jgi:predicted secreted protein
MLTRRLCSALMPLLGLLAMSLMAEDSTTVRVSARASASSVDGVEVSTGTFFIEHGARLAVEIVRDNPCVCLCDPIHVTEVLLLNSAGETIHQTRYEEEVDLSEWLGRVSLIDLESGEPLPNGEYTVRAVTSVGSFSAQIEAVSPSAMGDHSQSSVSASVCGLELQIYRLINADDHGASIPLRVGNRLMVALEGNVTTGFRWENTLQYEYAVLRETEDAEYRVWPHPEGMVGGGGEFLFRYEALDVGPQTFRFVHHQPWVSDDPDAVLEFDVTVY